MFSENTKAFLKIHDINRMEYIKFTYIYRYKGLFSCAPFYDDLDVVFNVLEKLAEKRKLKMIALQLKLFIYCVEHFQDVASRIALKKLMKLHDECLI